MMAFRSLAIAAGALALAACAKTPLATVPPAERAAIEARMLEDITVLASDEFGGREPGTDGERLTVNYLIEHMREAGLQSGTNDPGSAWLAPVRLVTSEAGESLITFETASDGFEISEEDGAAFTSNSRLLVDAADMIFVGKLGEAVPRESIAGKVVVMMGEPGVSPRRRAALFRKDPAAIITVVEDAQGIANVRRAFGSSRPSLVSEEEARLTAFITRDAMAMVLGQHQWAMMAEAAEDEDFTPRKLPATASMDATARRREFTSSNVIGMLPGAVPGSGAVLLLAHWDHLGECGSEEAEDRICNGAVDNASGVAMMLELARRLSGGEPLDRDIYFLGTTAEESGLLGAKAFVEAPPVPLETIIGAFNMDAVAVAPAGSPVGLVGEGMTPLDPIIRDIVRRSGRELGESEVADAYVRRQDGWALMDKGVPAVLISSAFGSRTILNSYTSSRYHRASDEVDTLELGGAIDDLLLQEEIIRRVANIATYTPPE